MRYSVRTIEREFPPREAAEITGLSTTNQRDWRRKKLLPERTEEGWTAFGLSDLVGMKLMKVLSESGIALATAKEIAGLSLLPILSEFANFEENYEFEGMQLSDEQRERIVATSIVGGPGGRFLMVPFPPVEDLYHRVCRGDDLQGMAEAMPEDCLHWLVLDHLKIAHSIMLSVGGPLYRVVVTELDD